MFYYVKPSIPEGLWFYVVKPKSSMLLKSSILTSLKAHRENPRAARTKNKANNYHACAKRMIITRKVTMVTQRVTILCFAQAWSPMRS